MRKFFAVSLGRVVLALLFIISLIVLGDMRVVKAEEALNVEGEWVCISTPTDDAMRLLNQALTISRKDGGYHAQWSNRPTNSWTYSGNDTQIVHSEMLPLLPVSSNPPDKVRREIGDTQFRHAFSYTLVGDGLSLEMAEEGVEISWDGNGNYDVKPTKVVWTLKRVTPTAPEHVSGAPVLASVESRGEFYFLTKDGRKVTGEDASKVPLEEGTKVVTGNDGHIKMTLPDNTTFTVGPNSDLVIDKFVYDPDKSPEKIMATMTKGVFRWVTGKTAQHDPTQMKVTLPVIAVGIRGTDFEATVEPDGNGSVVLNFGQLEITEKKTGFTFVMEDGQKITFGADGSVSRPLKI